MYGTFLIVLFGCIYSAHAMHQSLIDDFNGISYCAQKELYGALKKADKQRVNLILTYFSCKDFKNNRGQTPLHCAVQTGDYKLVELILDAQCPLDDYDKAGQTALHYAVFKNYEDITCLLLKRGADRTKKNIFGHIALDYAHTIAMHLILISTQCQVKSNTKISWKILTGLALAAGASSLVLRTLVHH
jgi:hypothetical protein